MCASLPCLCVFVCCVCCSGRGDGHFGLRGSQRSSGVDSLQEAAVRVAGSRAFGVCVRRPRAPAGETVSSGSCMQSTKGSQFEETARCTERHPRRPPTNGCCVNSRGQIRHCTLSVSFPRKPKHTYIHIYGFEYIYIYLKPYVL